MSIALVAEHAESASTRPPTTISRATTRVAAGRFRSRRLSARRDPHRGNARRSRRSGAGVLSSHRATIPAVGPILWSHSWHHMVSSTREVPSLPSVVGGPGYDSTPAPPFLKTFYPLVERSHGYGLAGLT
jgi:hypothetical protein